MSRLWCNDQQHDWSRLSFDFGTSSTLFLCNAVRSPIERMVSVIPPGSTINYLYHGTTHFLRIPLATTRSTRQLQRSIQRVAEDPGAAALPRVAWHVPDEINIPIASVSLKTPSRIGAAIQLLEHFGRTYSDSNRSSSAGE